LYQPDLLCLTQKPAIIFLSGVTNYWQLKKENK
jgi:hypothetical protein